MDASGWAALSGFATALGNRIQDRADDERKERLYQLQQAAQMKREEFLINAREAAAARERAAEQDAYNRKVTGTIKDPATGNIHNQYGDGRIDPTPAFETSPDFQANLRRGQQLDRDLNEARLNTLTSKLQKLRQSAAGEPNQPRGMFDNVTAGVNGVDQPSHRRTTTPRGKAPTGYQWTADGSRLEPIPGGPKDRAASQNPPGGSKQEQSKSKMDELNDAVARRALSFAAAVTNRKVDDIRRMSPEEIRDLVATQSRMTSGPIGGRIPFTSYDLEAYATAAGGAQARLNNPTGPVSNADTDLALKSVFGPTKPPQVNADLIYDALTQGSRGSAPGHQGTHRVGEVIQGPDGRKYRVVGGDPNDPDVEPAE